MKFPLTLFIALFLSLGNPSSIPVSPVDEVEDLLAELIEKKDEADSELIRELGEIASQPALEALISVFDKMESVYMRRAVLRAIANYDGIEELEHAAGSKIRDVITQDRNRQLRRIAVDTLASCRSIGHGYLKTVISSGADDDVRELCLRRHVSSATDSDLEWYYKLYSGRTRAEEKKAGEEGKKKLKKAERIKAAKKREKEGPVKEIHRLQILREIAFERIVSKLSMQELLKSVADRNAEIRTFAMSELENRGADEALDVAERTYRSFRNLAADRLVAARIISGAKGEAVIERFLKDGQRNDQSEEVSMGLADILVSFRNEDLQKASLKLLAKSKGLALRFALRLSAKIDSPKVEKSLLKIIKGKDQAAALAAIRILVARQSDVALAGLGKVVSRSKSPEVVAAALTAIGELNGMDEEWIERLTELASHKNLTIRNAALTSISTSGIKDLIEILLAGLKHENWSTRLTVAEAIRDTKLKVGVGALALRMKHESGRLALEFAGILFYLTGKPFGENGAIWEKWWQEEGAEFKFIKDSERRKLVEAREQRALKETTQSSFFGIKIESHFVVFVVDVSGSMEERTRGQFVGEEGPMRMDVAKKELKLAISSLEDNTFFNIIDFSSDAYSWESELMEVGGENTAKALAYVDDLSPGGGTNLFGALELAMDEVNVDTIYVLSDGEPSVGDVIDPFAIQRIIEDLNTRRQVKFNCIAIGGSLSVLEDLAESSGGSYVKIP